MIRKSDIQWWIREASRSPEAAEVIIQELAQRLTELDAENEALRDRLVQTERQSGPAAAPSQVDEQVAALRQQVETLQSVIKGQAAAETAVVLLSDQPRGARMPLSQVRLRLRGKEPALARSAALEVRRLLLARPQEDILLMTDQGLLGRLYLHKVPFIVNSEGWPDMPDHPFEASARITAAATVGKPPRFWTVVSRRGFVRQFLHLTLERVVDQNEVAFASPLERDHAVAMVDGDRGDLLLLTRWGKAIRFPQRAIESQGSVAIELEPDDEVVDALSLPTDAEILVLTASGYAMRRDSSRFAGRVKPGGTGRSLIQAYDAVKIIRYVPRGRLLYLTYAGRYAVADAAKIPLLTRHGKGTELLRLERDPAAGIVMVPGSLL